VSATILAANYVVNLQVLIVATVTAYATITQEHAVFVRSVPTAVELV
jgi:hypothetical protein